MTRVPDKLMIVCEQVDAHSSRDTAEYQYRISGDDLPGAWQPLIVQIAGCHRASSSPSWSIRIYRNDDEESTLSIDKLIVSLWHKFNTHADAFSAMVDVFRAIMLSTNAGRSEGN